MPGGIPFRPDRPPGAHAFGPSRLRIAPHSWPIRRNLEFPKHTSPRACRWAGPRARAGIPPPSRGCWRFPSLRKPVAAMNVLIRHHPTVCLLALAVCVSLFLSGCRQEAAQTPMTPSATTSAATPAGAETPVPPKPAAMPSAGTAPTPAPEASSASKFPDASADRQQASSGQASSGDVVLRPSFQACVDAAGGVTPATQDCISEEYAYHDARLNAAYRRLMASLSKDRATALRNEERTWLAERDNRCHWDADTEGQAQRLEANYCLMERTAQRAEELEAMPGHGP